MTAIDINIDAGESYGAWTHGRRRGHVPVRDLRQSRLRLPRRRSGLDVRGCAARARARTRDRRAPRPARSGRLRPARAARHARAGLRRRRLPGGRARGRARRARRDAAPRQAARRVLDARAPRIPPSPTACCARCTTSTRRCRSSSSRGRSSRAPPTRSATRACTRPFRSAATRPTACSPGAAPRAPSSRTSTRRRAARCAWQSRARWTRSTARPMSFRPRTLCVHGDNPHAARIAAAVRAALEAAGVELAAF